MVDEGWGASGGGFVAPGTACSGLAGLDCFVRGECDTTCLLIYACQYFASLLEDALELSRGDLPGCVGEASCGLVILVVLSVLRVFIAEVCRLSQRGHCCCPVAVLRIQLTGDRCTCSALQKNLRFVSPLGLLDGYSAERTGVLSPCCLCGTATPPKGVSVRTARFEHRKEIFWKNASTESAHFEVTTK